MSLLLCDEMALTIASRNRFEKANTRLAVRTKLSGRANRKILAKSKEGIFGKREVNRKLCS